MTRYVARFNVTNASVLVVAGGTPAVSVAPAMSPVVILVSDSEEEDSLSSESKSESEDESSGFLSNIYSAKDYVVGRDVAASSYMECSSSEYDSDGDNSEHDPSEVRFHAEEAIYVMQCRMVARLVAQGIPDVKLPCVTGAFLLARAKVLSSEWDSMGNSHEYDSCLNGHANQVQRSPRCLRFLITSRRNVDLPRILVTLGSLGGPRGRSRVVGRPEVFVVTASSFPTIPPSTSTRFNRWRPRFV